MLCRSFFIFTRILPAAGRPRVLAPLQTRFPEYRAARGAVLLTDEKEIHEQQRQIPVAMRRQTMNGLFMPQ
jgi:hypothetical protein